MYQDGGIFAYLHSTMSANIINRPIFPSACGQCAQERLTCCYYQHDTIADMMLPTSYIECKNICSFLGFSSIDTFFEEEEVTESFQKNIKAMFPGESEAIERIFPLGGTRFRVALRGEIKHCVFLTPRGCFLPHTIRPILCQLFPFWVYKNGDLSLFGNCNLAPEGVEIVESMQRASLSIVEIYTLYNVLRMYWGI
ncbi:MAG: hypothetical protein K2M30_04555 [Desulfovibrionaceae bacterium]|nr:hypothetical protein [Desulfovibrionaceae bacterium]